MKHVLTILLLSSFLNSYGQTDSAPVVNTANNEHATYNAQVFQYRAWTIPQFFKTLTRNHLRDFYMIDSLEFNQFCTQHNINPVDSSNIKKYFTIKILHEIFTSQGASNCSRGAIVNIPYQWHYTQPNPRYQIRLTSNNRLIRDSRPPTEYSRYATYADIDRTPYLYLSDLVNAEEKYYSESCGSFSTFGWCSEREMAFVSLVKLLEFEGKTVAEYNHSWSELIIPMRSNTGVLQNFKVRVDNTFDQVSWSPFASQDLTTWRGYFGNTREAGWYNRKANSRQELDRIRNHRVSSSFAVRLENNIVEYLNSNIR